MRDFATADDELVWHRYEQELKAEAKSGRTIENYRYTLTLLSEWCATTGGGMTEAGAATVTGWLADGGAAAGGSWSSSTRGSHFRRARTFYSWAIRKEYRDDPSHPMATLRPPKQTEHLPEVPDIEDIRKLLATCASKNYTDRRDLAMLRILCEAGTPRASELAGLLVADVDMRHDTITIRGKGGLERQIPFGAKTAHALTLYLRERAKLRRAADFPELFLGMRPEQPMTRSGVLQMIKKRARRAGLPAGMYAHLFRHFTADQFFANGGTERDGMKLYGWRVDTMAKLYGGAAAARRAVEYARGTAQGDAI